MDAVEPSLQRKALVQEADTQCDVIMQLPLTMRVHYLVEVSRGMRVPIGMGMLFMILMPGFFGFMIMALFSLVLVLGPTFVLGLLRKVLGVAVLLTVGVIFTSDDEDESCACLRVPAATVMS